MAYGDPLPGLTAVGTVADEEPSSLQPLPAGPSPTGAVTGSYGDPLPGLTAIGEDAPAEGPGSYGDPLPGLTAIGEASPLAEEEEDPLFGTESAVPLAEIMSDYPLEEAMDAVRGPAFASAGLGSRARALDSLAERLVSEGIYDRRQLLFPPEYRSVLEEKDFTVGFPEINWADVGAGDVSSVTDARPSRLPYDEAAMGHEGAVDFGKALHEGYLGTPIGGPPGVPLSLKGAHGGLMTSEGLADQLNLTGVLKKKFVNSLVQADQARGLASVEFGEISMPEPEDPWAQKLLTELTIPITFGPAFIAGSAETLGSDFHNWVENQQTPIPGEGNSVEEREILSAIDGELALDAIKSSRSVISQLQQAARLRSIGADEPKVAVGKMALGLADSFGFVAKISRRTGIPFADVLQGLFDAERVAGGDDTRRHDLIRGYFNSQWRVTAPGERPDIPMQPSFIMEEPGPTAEEGGYPILPPGMIGKSDTERRILAEMYAEDPDMFTPKAEDVDIGLLAPPGGLAIGAAMKLRIAKRVGIEIEKSNEAKITQMAQDGAFGQVMQEDPNMALGVYADAAGLFKEGIYGSAFLEFIKMQVEYMAVEMPVNAAKALAAFVDWRFIGGGGVKPYETPSEWDKFVQDGRDNWRDHPGVTLVDFSATSALLGKGVKKILKSPEALQWALASRIKGLEASAAGIVANGAKTVANVMRESPGIAQRVADRVPQNLVAAGAKRPPGAEAAQAAAAIAPAEMPVGAAHPTGFFARTRKKGITPEELAVEVAKLDTSIMDNIPGWADELPILAERRTVALEAKRAAEKAAKENPGDIPAAKRLAEAQHENLTAQTALKRKLTQLDKALANHFKKVELERMIMEKAQAAHDARFTEARDKGLRVVDTETGSAIPTDVPLDPAQAAAVRRGAFDVGEPAGVPTVRTTTPAWERSSDAIVTRNYETGPAIRKAGERRGQDNNRLGDSVDRVALEVESIEAPMRLMDPTHDVTHFRGEEGVVPERSPAETTVRNFEDTRGTGGEFYIGEMALGQDLAVLDLLEARIAAEKGFVDTNASKNLPNTASVMDIADLHAYRMSMPPKMRATELAARGLGDYQLFEFLAREWGGTKKEAEYLAWSARNAKEGQRVVGSPVEAYSKALTDAAARDGVTPEQWLAKNAREQRAESMIEAGVTDHAAYEYMGFGADEAAALAQAGAGKQPKATVIEKRPWGAADAIDGINPVAAADMIAKSAESNLRATEEALMGRMGEKPTRAPSFEGVERPAWWWTASLFLDKSGLDILGGFKESPYGRKGLRHNIYGITEFMERPFAFAKIPYTVIDYFGNNLRLKFEGREIPKPLNAAQGIIWYMTSPSNKLGYTNFHDLATAGRTGGILSDQVSHVIKKLAGKEVKFTEKDYQALLESIDVPYAESGYAGQYASDGWQIIGASDKPAIFSSQYANRVVDVTKRWIDDFVIEDANGNKTRLGEFAEKYIVDFEGRKVTVARLQEMVSSGEISIQRAKRGARGYEYGPKEGMKWSDLTDQQRSILLIANKLTAPLDKAFFDRAVELATSTEAMRLTLGEGKAQFDALLKSTKENIIEMASNWMTDYYDPRATFSLLVDTISQMTKTGIDASALDGLLGTTTMMDVMLGRIAPGGGTKEISIATIRRYPEHFTKEMLKKRLERWEINVEAVAGKKPTLENLIKAQPELAFSEIIELWKDSPEFKNHYSGGKPPPDIVERYFKSKVWDPHLSYAEKIEWGLHDVREAASKAALNMGAALAHQKLIVKMRQSGMILTQLERDSLTPMATRDSNAVFGKDSTGARVAQERASRLRDQYVNPGEGFATVDGHKIWSDLEGEFFIHKAVNKYLGDQVVMFDKMQHWTSKAHQNVKLGLVFDPIGGTLLRNYFSNRWMMGFMAKIPWNQMQNKRANKMIRDFYEEGVVDPLYIRIREAGYGKATAAHTEFSNVENFLKMDLEVSERTQHLSRGILDDNVPIDSATASRLSAMMTYGAESALTKRGGKKGEFKMDTPEGGFFKSLSLNEMRAPLESWTQREGLGGTRKSTIAEKTGVAARKAKRWMVEEYGVIDDTAKLSYILQLIDEHGFSPKEAVIAADKAFMAYDDVAPIINLLRNNAAGALLSQPFIVFATKALEKAYRMIAESPMRAFVWSNLMQGQIHATSALLGVDKEEIMSLLVSTGKMALPTRGSQLAMRGARGSTRRKIGPDGYPTERDPFNMLDAGPMTVDLGLWEFGIPRQYREGQRIRERIVTPGVPGMILKSIATLSTMFGGESPGIATLRNMFTAGGADKTDDELADESYRNANESTLNQFIRMGNEILDPLLPSAYRSGFKYAGALMGGDEILGIRGKKWERLTTAAGVKVSVTSMQDKVLQGERRLNMVLSAISAAHASLKKKRVNWTESGKWTKDLEKRWKTIDFYHTNASLIKKGAKAVNNAEIMRRWREWLPTVYAALENASEDIEGRRPEGQLVTVLISALDKQKRGKDLSSDEELAIKVRDKLEALRGVARIGQEMNIGVKDMPYFPEAAGGPQ